jgi:hypothetical protein
MIRAATLTASLLCAATLLAGCVPIPYKPAVSVQHDVITPEAAPAILLKAEPPAWAGKVGEQLRRAEPRIVLMDGTKALPDALDFISLPDAIAALAKLPPGPDTPDYLLGMSPFAEEEQSKTDIYQPGVGYYKDKYVGHLPSLLVELRSGRPADAMDFKSEYSMVVVELFYGVMTVPEGEKAVDSALVAEVARRLKAAQPQGPIRLLVMFQKPKEAPPPPATATKTGAELKPP